MTALRVRSPDPRAVMNAMWKHLAAPEMWPLYRVGFALQLRDDVSTPDEERAAWAEVLIPVLRDLGFTPAHARDEALLWVATCRGLLWELVTGADEKSVHRAARRFFAHYR
ncbi:hypothetical protein FPZ12_026360 [Amycolatopsis acidicola]|uniref:Uncharacterized protein n=1 Tax=Amycolatopsis acidicola TaxID=2596893 RepID=A0A5N0V1G9_9PSEU|nr:hypothetical protein FPZ12_026360 [Amycolatopsis acidicola]